MSRPYKIVVTGPFNAGKTQFIATISEIEIVRTERRITTEDRGIKANTTVAMDYGRVTQENKLIHLHGTPGQSRFDFMWEILANDMQGFIVLVDSTDPPSFSEAAELVTIFSAFHAVPYLIVANKADLEGAVSLSQVRSGTHTGGDVTVMPCVATQKSSVWQVLRQMVDLIDFAR